MRNIVLSVIIFFLFFNELYSQSKCFIKRITNNEYDNVSFSIKQGINNNYYLILRKQDFITGINSRKYFIRIDEFGDIKDSIVIDSILGKKNSTITPIIKYKNAFLYYTTLSDNDYHYLYVSIFDTNLQILNEQIIDTLLANEWVMDYNLGYDRSHVFLTASTENSSWCYNIYQFDSVFNLNRKFVKEYCDGYNSSIVFIKKDSSYLITTRNWIVKTNYDFSSFDTVINRWQTETIFTWCQTKTYNDSIYFESAITGGDINYSFPGFFVRKINAEIVDTFAFSTIYEKNDITQFKDFFSFTTPDTLFYCSNASSVYFDEQGLSGILVVKFNMDKNVYWQKYFGFDGNYQYGSIEATSDGGCIIQWSFWDWMNYPDDWRQANVVLVKTDKNGNAPVGTNENIYASEKQVLVYPNPAQDIINFETGLYNKLTLEIYSSSGILLQKQHLKQGKNTITISKLGQGMYFYRLINIDKPLESGAFIKL